MTYSQDEFIDIQDRLRECHRVRDRQVRELEEAQEKVAKAHKDKFAYFVAGVMFGFIVTAITLLVVVL